MSEIYKLTSLDDVLEKMGELWGGQVCFGENETVITLRNSKNSFISIEEDIYVDRDLNSLATKDFIFTVGISLLIKCNIQSDVFQFIFENGCFYVPINPEMCHSILFQAEDGSYCYI